MLSKTENKVMSVIYAECKDRRSFLISPIDLIKLSGVDKITLSEMERVVSDLQTDGYFDLVYSDRRGETVYCISLTEKGKRYSRDVKLLRRNVVFRLCLTVSLAILSFVIGLILKAIFKR